MPAALKGNAVKSIESFNPWPREARSGNRRRSGLSAMGLTTCVFPNQNPSRRCLKGRHSVMQTSCVGLSGLPMRDFR